MTLKTWIASSQASRNDSSRNIKGFTFVELLISTALGVLLLLGLASLFQHFLVSYRATQALANLYDEAAVITRLWQQDFSNVKIYQVGLDALPGNFPKASRKKLLPGSIIIEESALVAVIPAHAGIHVNDRKMDSRVRGNDGSVEGDSKTTFWFAMKNSDNAYGIYRIILPAETAPAELISHVKSFQAQARLPSGQFQTASSALPWSEIKIVRIQLKLSEKGQTLNWPVSLAIAPQAFHWKPA